MKANEAPIDRRLSAAARVVGLPLCLHLLERPGAAAGWRLHQTTPCLAMKRRARWRCREFDARAVHEELPRTPAGRIHQCPFGFTEIAVPLLQEGRLLGVLFAGPVWTQQASPPHPSLPICREPQWLQDRLLLLSSVAEQLTRLLHTPPADDRLEQIRAFLRDRLTRPVTLTQLARHLSRSPSRTGHLVKELSGMSFSQLRQHSRMSEAARQLAISDAPISEVAARVGYSDQNYFARLFRRHFGISPRAYRRRALTPE